MSALTLLKVPRRMDWRGMMPNQVFNLIDAGRADGGEVKLDVRIILQPGHHLRGSVGGEVVQDHMNLFARVTFHGFLEEGQEVVTVAGGLALTEDLSGADVQRREEI